MHVNTFFSYELIYNIITDVNAQIRMASAEALRSCFELVSHRNSQNTLTWYTLLYDSAVQQCKERDSGPAAVHGALLTLDESVLFVPCSSVFPSSVC